MVLFLLDCFLRSRFVLLLMVCRSRKDVGMLVCRFNHLPRLCIAYLHVTVLLQLFAPHMLLVVGLGGQPASLSAPRMSRSSLTSGD